jgi:hypothetical protein
MRQVHDFSWRDFLEGVAKGETGRPAHQHKNAVAVKSKRTSKRYSKNNACHAAK